MMRAVAGGVVVAIVAIAIGLAWYSREQAREQSLTQQISQLGDELSKAKADNEHLKESLTNMQTEQERLARQNDALTKALEQAKITGKAPGMTVLPYPPK